MRRTLRSAAALAAPTASLVFWGLSASVLAGPAIAGERSSGPAIGIGIGTLGLVGELSFKAADSLVLRFNGNWADLDYDKTVDANAFQGSMRFYGAGAIADWHPFQNGFRLSGGVRYHDAEFSGKVTGSDITVNGVTYTPAQYGALTATVWNVNKVAPYVGIGWDSAHYAESGFSLAIEAGVIYVGGHDATLTTTASVPGLQANLDAEVQKIKDDYGRFSQFWPVVSLAAKYRF